MSWHSSVVLAVEERILVSLGDVVWRDSRLFTIRLLDILVRMCILSECLPMMMTHPYHRPVQNVCISMEPWSERRCTERCECVCFPGSFWVCNLMLRNEMHHQLRQAFVFRTTAEFVCDQPLFYG